MLPKVKPIHPQSIGLGLRFPHFDKTLNEETITPWFEVITEDFISDGPHHIKLEKLRSNKPIVFHSIGMNIGGTQKIDTSYLRRFNELYNKYEPDWISDHICWSAHNGRYHHDLLPIPKTKEALKNVCERIQYLQDYFKRNLVLENITSYFDYKNEQFSEIEFLKEIVSLTECFLLLDITNVIINHTNRSKDYSNYFSNFPIKSVKQVHLSGGEKIDDHIIDSHSQLVNKNDILIFKKLINNGLSAAAIIERDSNLPSFHDLELERQKISRTVYELH